MVNPVGFVGAGHMGEPMVERLLATGTPVQVFVRRPEVRTRLAALGAETPGSMAELDAGIVVLCLFSEAQLREVVLGPDGLAAALRPGAILVNHTTTGLDVLDEVAAAVRDHGAELVDAPVSGTDDAIRAGKLTVLLGGEPDAVAQADEVVSAYSDNRVRTGPAGSAARVKLVNNVLFAAHLQTAAAAIELGTGLGLTEAELVGALLSCSSASTALGYIQHFGSLDAIVDKAADYLRKDVESAAATAQRCDIDLGRLGEVARAGPLPLTNQR